jgi:hypothetical protein
MKAEQGPRLRGCDPECGLGADEEILLIRDVRSEAPAA